MTTSPGRSELKRTPSAGSAIQSSIEIVQRSRGGAVLTTTDGSVESIAGTSLLRFDPDGLVVEQRDAGASEPGRRELPDWASS